MFLHLISTFVFSIPITTHILKIALTSTFTIGNFVFTNERSTLLILLILAIVSANIYSIVTDKSHKLSFLVTGGFLLVITVTQACIISFGAFQMCVFGELWPEDISIIEIIITGGLGAILLLSATLLKLNEPKNTDKSESANTLQDTIKNTKSATELIRRLDKHLAFLFGIVCSLVLAVPVCGCLYLLADILIEDDDLSSKHLKLLVWIGIVGMQGSIVSMFLGLRRFRDKSLNNLDSLDLFINTLFRPFIGMSFANLTFFMMESGILTGTGTAKIINGDLVYSFEYHVCLAFIAGFTERIVKIIQSDDTFSDRTKEVKALGH